MEIIGKVDAIRTEVECKKRFHIPAPNNGDYGVLWQMWWIHYLPSLPNMIMLGRQYLSHQENKDRSCQIIQSIDQIDLVMLLGLCPQHHSFPYQNNHCCSISS